jgi:hypothetical protein
MHVTENPEDRISVVQMNSELQHAQLELISAHCASYKLRLRFSAENIARYARRDVLLKCIETASILNKYFATIEEQIPAHKGASALAGGFTEKQIADAVERVSSYLGEQREQYLASASRLSDQQKTLVTPYFSEHLLDEVRIVELQGDRIPSPPFYAKAKALGFVNLPDFSHMNCVTFVDVLVFNEKITGRSLFHALVGAAQYRELGLQRYTELFVRSFINARFHFLVPLEAHAFFLESKFARPGAGMFSVEEQVRLWAKQNRY